MEASTACANASHGSFGHGTVSFGQFMAAVDVSVIIRSAIAGKSTLLYSIPGSSYSTVIGTILCSVGTNIVPKS